MAMFVDGIPVMGGIPGPGIPKGGTDGQLLVKDGSKNYHGRWADPGDVALVPPKSYGDGAPIPTRATDILAPSWTGQTTVTGTHSPDSPATLTGVPFAATATGPDGQTRSVNLGFTGYSLLDGTADSYDGVLGEFVQRVEKLVLDTIDVFSIYSAQRPAGSRTMMFSTKVTSKQEELSLVCSHLPTRNVWDNDEEGAMAIGSGDYKRIAFSMLTSRLTAYGLVESDSTTHIPAIKAWFAAQAAAGTPVTVYYALVQPVAYNRKADLQAFDGQTTVTGATTVEVIEGRIDRLAGYAYYEVVQVRPNRLINSDFRQTVNQRGQKSYRGAVYGIDMWTSTSPYATVTVEKDGMALEADEGKTIYWMQRLEDTAKAGKIYTASVLVAALDGTGYLQIIYKSGKLSPFARLQQGMVDITLLAEDDIARVLIQLNNGGSAKLTAAKLEAGPTQTLARKVGGQWVLNDPPPDPTLELLKCQRYQLSILDPLITGQSYIFKGKASEPSRFYGVLPTPVPMRTIPRVITDCSESTPYTAFGIVSSGYSSKIQITEIGAYSKMQNGVVLFATGSNIVRGNDYQVYIEKTNTHQFLLDANL